ncbi:PPE family protein [Mycobacterium cookii]|uniref:PPE family protein n=1 Tax=Mycobacterium cookii TaxID=1775 RepID=A0A7I7KRW5_9MYCO|nr:PPE family protein [Mycobacterium cookii]MCV7331184.1 PPE family protein [Mycobacterium cookii]BBX44860.1 PPE family protein [Mycobacterium cookii]
MLDYGMFPPEINSARMYAGPGVGSMLAAAAGWDGLASDLRSQATNYMSVVSALTTEGWRGPASMSMAAAAAPYAAWMNSTAAQAEETAAQAKAAASAYESAFSMTVPPSIVTANRTQLAALVATNVLGQNTPAIAANEAEYAGMWAQDAGAMYGYAGQSATASQLAPFVVPAQTTSSGGIAAQSALTQLTTGMPTALQGLASGSSTSTTSGSAGLSSLLSSVTGDGSSSGIFSSSGLGLNNNFWNTVSSTGAFSPAQIVQAVTGSSFLGTGMAGVQNAVPPAVVTGYSPATAVVPAVSGFSEFGGAGSSVSAGVGRAATLGTLSVPPAWTSIATPNSPLASALGATPLSAPRSAPPGMPGMPVPAGTPTANTAAATAPKYGFRPTVVMQSPLAG